MKTKVQKLKKYKMRIEDKFHAECYQWMHNNYPWLRGLFFSIANESASGREANKRKAMGRVVRKGVYDFHVDLPSGEHVGLKVEFKSPKGGLSKEQKQMREVYLLLNYRCESIRPPLMNFINLIDNYINSCEESLLEGLKTLHDKHYKK